uniref:Cadherin prodomain domain-containing protein n=1 Tax=Scleropages formosus TaxID=113540 RepID=A0A8C9VUH6_SCLFO
MREPGRKTAGKACAVAGNLGSGCCVQQKCLHCSAGRISLSLAPPCRPGFSESFYTVFVSRDILQGQSILKGKVESLFAKCVCFFIPPHSLDIWRWCAGMFV